MKRIKLTMNGQSEALKGWPLGFVAEVDDETFARWMSEDVENADVQVFIIPDGDDRGSLFAEVSLQYEDTPA